MQELEASGARALVAASPANVQYVTGFSSPVASIAPVARLGVFTREGTALVLPAVEVAAAVDARAGVDHLICHGRLPRLRTDAPIGGDGRRVERIVGDAAPGPAEALLDALARLGAADGPVALDERGLSAAGWRAIAERLAGSELAPGSERFATARRVKSPYELERCAHALRIAEEALDAVIQALDRGTTEREAANVYAGEVARRGAVPTWMHVAFGDRTWMPAAWPTDQTLRPGALVRLDAGCAHRGYSASIARTAVLGEPAPRIWDVYGTLHGALDAATGAMTDGAATDRVVAAALGGAGSLDSACERWAEIGYGIGIEPRESPTLDARETTALAAGEVLCVELPYCEIGHVGVGIRNTVLVTTAGARVLNQSRDDLVILD